MHTISTFVLLASVLMLGIVAIQSTTTSANAQISASGVALAGGEVGGGAFASIKTEITDSQIVITIDKNPNSPPIDPDGPIVIIPPNETSGPDNGTVILPVEPEAPGSNATVISPEGNVTQIPDGNVTVIDNGTVIVDDSNSTVTEIPDDIVVISPPPNATTTEPEPCTCPIGIEGAAPDIQLPNATAPIIGGNITMSNETTIIRPDTEPGEESGNGNGGNGNGDNGGG